jgi:transglutaminase-like putative cysteine protease
VTTTQLKKPTLWNKFIQNARTFLIPGDLTALLMTVTLLILPALALNAAEWPLEMGVILPITILSAIFGFLLARSQYNELLALMLSTGYGVCFLLLITGFQVPGGVYEVLTRTILWVVDATTGGINQDEVVFTLLVGTLFWFLGYNAAWHVFRIDRVWRVVLPPALILITNVVFYPGNANLDFYMIGFLFVALLLIARSNLDAREWEWYSNGVRVPRELRRQFLQVSAGLTLVVLLLAWIVPSGNLQERLNDFQSFLRSEPMSQINELLNRLFVPIAAEGPTSVDYYGGETLELGGAIRLGDQEVLLVNVPQGRRYYWRSRVFDTYELGRWTPGADIRLKMDEGPLNIQYEPSGAREAVDQQFTIALRSSRLVYTAPQPSRINLATSTDLQYISQIEPKLMNISVIRPRNVLNRGTTYTATSLMSVATADQLRNVGTNYPDWILNHPQYLRDSDWIISQQTRALAQQIVDQAGAVTPYDKAKAIETWLRQNITYNETIPEPPTGQDPVDWMLFHIKEGYCQYYATAMIVMLRSQDIPARMAAGFAQGTWDSEQGGFVVREKDAHTWVEAYFPGYGWIEFEPTSAQAPLTREGDDQLSQAQINPEQSQIPATSTPMPTDTPTATPTSDPDEAGASNQSTPDMPTITLTFTPSPTATPVIIPTKPAPLQPENRNPLAFILPAIGLALLGILFLALIVGIGVFIWWWWEWRGLRELSPITRAYARLERYLPLIGIRFNPQQTPEERRRRVMRDLPGAERPVTAITRLYISERYGPGLQHPAESDRQAEIADKAWGNALGSILKRWGRKFQFWRRKKR